MTRATTPGTTTEPANIRPAGDRGPDGDPRPNPGPKDPPPPPTGEIGKKWKAMGGYDWAVPTTVEKAEGGGRIVSFRLPNHTFIAIVWSQRTGARLVNSDMDKPWRLAGGGAGPLGLPNGDNAATHDNAGRYQGFEGGVVVFHALFGAHEVHGEIYRRYGLLNGSHYGYPTTDETATPDGVGRFNHFRRLSTGADASIYWTQATGAWEIAGDIRSKWAALGWERSALGYPTSDERPAHDQVGRYQVFQGGVIVWHPTLGAFSVVGDIYARYYAVGGSPWGYPITDEKMTADRTGRFNHFRQLETGSERSIYWHPGIGAFSVADEIRQRWSELRWENGHLGYPIEEPKPWTGIPRAQVAQEFQHGRILQNSSGAFPDPMRWEQSFRSGGVSGAVTVVANSAGDVDLSGYIRSNALVGFDYLLQILLVSDGHGLVSFTKKGHVSSTHGSDEKDNFTGHLNNPYVQLQYEEFAGGQLRLQQQHENSFTATLGDLAMGVLKWTAGELVLTPGNALILIAATEIVSAATSGSLVPGMQVIDGTLWLAGPAGTAIALIADAATRLATKERDLEEEDYRRANLVFRGTLPPRENIRVTNALGGGGRYYTYPRFDGKILLNMGDDMDSPWTARTEEHSKDGQALVHELTHAWQCHNDPTSIVYIGEALWGKVAPRPDPGETPDHDWDFYSQEQQAQIVDQWFAEYFQDYPLATESTEYGLARKVAIDDIRFPFIEQNIRGRRP